MPKEVVKIEILEIQAEIGTKTAVLILEMIEMIEIGTEIGTETEPDQTQKILEGVSIVERMDIGLVIVLMREEEIDVSIVDEEVI